MGDIHHPVIIAKRENEPEEELHTFHEFEDRFDSVPSSDATTSFRTRSTSIRPANTFFDSLSNARRLFTVNFRHDHIKGRGTFRRTAGEDSTLPREVSCMLCFGIQSRGGERATTNNS